MVTDASVLRLMQVRGGLKGLTVARVQTSLARIVERSHLYCRKPVRRHP
jgi:hypothetical protein